MDETVSARNRQTRIEVPGDSASYFPDISEFALSYNAYQRCGGFAGAAKISKDVNRHYRDYGEVPDDLERLRAALFFEQRRFRHYGWDPEGDELRFVREIVRKIREVSGGFLQGPSDFIDRTFDCGHESVDGP